MFLFFRSCSGSVYQSKQQHRVSQIQLRTYVDGTINWVRDRGLDHAVEREKNLMPVMNIKEFIKSEPSKSVPVSIITQKREVLRIPTRPIELIRQYPSIFEEFLPGGIGIQPHVRLTSKVLELDAEEQLTYQSETCRQQAADRLVKLLMLLRVHKIPLSIIDQMKWDLGLPKDYVQSIVPEFPDYFKVGHQNFASGSGNMQVLELVCWNNELATSVFEKMSTKVKPDTSKVTPITFPMKFSNGFVMDKKFKKWVDDWQKLPYISPYENASHLSPNSDESDKWTVAILHEILHMLVTKKTEKENILCIGEYFGLRSRFKRALLHHPGIFYLSSKAGTYTVVLQEGYKRGSVVGSSPLMNIRNKYLHLMKTVKEGSKAASEHSGSRQQKQKQKEASDDGFGKTNEAELFDSTDDEDEDASINDNEDASINDDEDASINDDEDASSNHEVRADQKEDGHKRHADFKENVARNRVRSSKRMNEDASSNHNGRADRQEDGHKRHVDFKENVARDRVRSSKRMNDDASSNHNVRADRQEDGRKRHVDFKENAARRVRSAKRKNEDASSNHNVRVDRNEDGQNKRHIDFKENAARRVRSSKRMNEDASSNHYVGADRKEDGRKRHIDFKENADRNRVRSSKRTNEYASSSHYVGADRKDDGRKRHIDFKENADRNRVRSSKRMNSTTDRPSRDVKRERYPVRMRT